jgi:hypothetical protein
MTRNLAFHGHGCASVATGYFEKNRQRSNVGKTQTTLIDIFQTEETNTHTTHTHAQAYRNGYQACLRTSHDCLQGYVQRSTTKTYEYQRTNYANTSLRDLVGRPARASPASPSRLASLFLNMARTNVQTKNSSTSTQAYRYKGSVSLRCEYDLLDHFTKNCMGH